MKKTNTPTPPPPISFEEASTTITFNLLTEVYRTVEAAQPVKGFANEKLLYEAQRAVADALVVFDSERENYLWSRRYALAKACHKVIKDLRRIDEWITETLVNLGDLTER